MDPAVAAALQEALFGERRSRGHALATLSDLRPRQLEGFLAAWLAAPVKRRRSIAATLIEVAEENFDLFFEEVFKVLLDDPDPEVRRAAIEGLCGTDDMRVAERMLGILAGDTDERVRAQAAITLGHFTFLAELEEISARDAARIRAGLLPAATGGDESLEVRRRAIEALGFLANDAQIHEIIAAAYAAPEVKMRGSALFAMGRNSDRRWRPIVLAALDSEETELRFEAARAAGELDDRRAVPALLRLVEDEDFEVRLEAIAALGKIGGDRAEAALRRLASHRDERIAEAAAEALSEAELFADLPDE